MKESRMKGVNFVKKLSMTKKKVVRNFGENRRELFKIFCLKINFTKILAPQYLWPKFLLPNIYDKSTPVPGAGATFPRLIFSNEKTCIDFYIDFPLLTKLLICTAVSYLIVSPHRRSAFHRFWESNHSPWRDPATRHNTVSFVSEKKRERDMTRTNTKTRRHIVRDAKTEESRYRASGI